MRSMAGRDELVDAIASFALFADLNQAQLEGIAHIFDEAMFAEGERVLRQGLTGSGFYVILDGEAAIVVDGTERARLARGEFFGEVSIILGESPIADVVAIRPLRCLVLVGSAGRAVPHRPPAGHVPDAAGPGAPAASRQPMAELNRPFPPGEYPVVVVGSGPGALQFSYSLRRHGIDHAVISADPSPGGMFRRWPFFQRLLSWTKPHAPAARGSRAYQRYDWNSLLGEEPETRAIQPGLMDGTSYFPSRPEMEANLVAFTEKAALQVRYDCRWTATRVDDAPEGRRFTLETTDGEYTCRILVIAVGVAEPFIPPGEGLEHAYHYADVKPAAEYEDKRVFIIGKQNSGFELANGLLPWARQLDPRLAIDRPPVGRHQVARRGSRPLRPAVRGPRAGRRRQRPRCGARPDRAAARWCVRHPPPPDRRRRRPHDRGRRGDLRDRVHLPAARPARARGDDVRGEPAAGPDALVGELEPARGLLRGNDRPGCQGPPEARHTGQLRSRARRALQRQGPRGPDRPDRVRHRSPSVRILPRTPSPRSSRPSWPRRPISSTSAAISPVCSRSTRTAGFATRGSSR